MSILERNCLNSGATLPMVMASTNCSPACLPIVLCHDALPLDFLTFHFFAAVLSVRFASDGSERVLSGSSGTSNNLKIWASSTGGERTSFEGFAGVVMIAIVLSLTYWFLCSFWFLV